MTQTKIFNALNDNFNIETYNQLVLLYGKKDVDFMIAYTSLYDKFSLLPNKDEYKLLYNPLKRKK